MVEILYLGSRGIVLSIQVAKTKALISFAVTAKLICVFVFAYAKSWFSHDAALIVNSRKGNTKYDLKLLTNQTGITEEQI